MIFVFVHVTTVTVLLWGASAIGLFDHEWYVTALVVLGLLSVWPIVAGTLFFLIAAIAAAVSDAD